MRLHSLNWWVGLPLLALCAFVVLLTALPTADTETRQRADYYHYVAMAYNVARYGVMGHRESSPMPARPSRLREPMYPLTLAVGLTLSEGALEESLRCVARKSACAGYRENLMLVNIVTITVLIALVFVAARIVTSSWIAAYLAGFLMISANFFVKYNSQIALTSEPLAALLLLVHALFLFLLVRERRGKLLFAALAGLSLGLLVLTKAVFQFWPLLIASGCILFLAYRFRKHHFAFLPTVLVLVLTSLAPPAAWSVRNYHHFGDFKLSDRGGRALLGRAVFLDMTPSEYRGALCAWAPSRPRAIQQLACEGVPDTDLARFNRTKEAQGTFDKFKVRKKEEYERLKSQGLTNQSWDDYYGDAAVTMIRENVVKHISQIPLFFYRGMWINVKPRHENIDVLPFSLAVPFKTFGNLITNLAGLLLPSGLLVGLFALLWRRYDVLLFVLPALYSIGVHSVFTTYISRYSTPLVPVLMVCLVYIGVILVRFLVHRMQTHENP
jgi:4-amino-4-deoxy-L-arabinose transferase-like glycosyltransferase